MEKYFKWQTCIAHLNVIFPIRWVIAWKRKFFSVFPKFIICKVKRDRTEMLNFNEWLNEWMKVAERKQKSQLKLYLQVIHISLLSACVQVVTIFKLITIVQ